MKTPLEIWAGVECTINRVGDEFFSQCQLSQHHERDDDVKKFADLGIKTIRYPFLWEEATTQIGAEPQWDRFVRRNQILSQHGIKPIAGLLHHGSGPLGTDLTAENFATEFARYARSFAERFPHIDLYTPINEPNTTARFSCLYGVWYPHKRDERIYVQALLNQIRATVLAMHEIRKINSEAKLIQTDDLGRAQGTPHLKYQTDYENFRRWLGFDLLFGRVNREHPLYERLTTLGGADPDELKWFTDHPCPPDIIGINTYLLSNRYLDERLERYPEAYHGGNGLDAYADVPAVLVKESEPVTPRSLLSETFDRYQTAIAVTEVHVDGPRETQLRWFEQIWTDCKSLRESGVPVQAVTAWSLLGSFDWNSLCTAKAGYYESGVFDIRSGQLRPTAIAKYLQDLIAQGESVHPALDSPGWWTKQLAPPGKNKILVTGANGTLGKAFARLLQARGLEAIVVARAKMDIANESSVRDALDQIKPWAVINTAGFVDVDRAEVECERCQRENVVGAEILARECDRRGISFVTFSSDLVFNGEQSVPYLESSHPAPLNQYGRSKLTAETLVRQRHAKSLVIRTSSFFGPWDQANFATQILNALASNRAVEVAADVTISPTYVPDLVNRSLDHLIDRSEGILHLTNSTFLTWAEFAHAIAERGGLNRDLIRPRTYRDLRWTAPRPKFSAMKSHFGELLPPLANAIERFFEDKEQK